MADNDLRAILGEDTDPTPPADATVPKKEPEPSEEDKEVARKTQVKANLDKAILEAQETLRKTRKATKNPKADEDEDIPQIDMDDPAAKAWDRRIRETSAPIAAEMEKEKEEVRTFALREFLQDKPSLAANPEKLQQVMATYDRLKTSSERTREGVILDLEKAYAAEHHEELIDLARNRRIETAQGDALLSDIAVSRGSTSYSNPKEATPNLSEEDKAIIAKWGITPTEWIADKKKYG